MTWYSSRTAPMRNNHPAIQSLNQNETNQPNGRKTEQMKPEEPMEEPNMLEVEQREIDWEWTRFNWREAELWEIARAQGSGLEESRSQPTRESLLERYGSKGRKERSIASPTSVSTPSTSPSNPPLDPVLTVLRFLAGKCDHARLLDGQGFNKHDAEKGHELAELTELRQGQRMTALRMIKKYHRQIPQDMWDALPSEGKPMAVPEQKEKEPETPFDGPKKKGPSFRTGNGGTVGGSSGGRTFKRSKPLTIHSEMPFGKHKGDRFVDMAERDPDYLRWCLQNWGSDKQDILDVMEKALEEAGEDY